MMTYRNRVNTWSGRVAPFVLLLLTLCFDPLSAFSAESVLEGAWIPVVLFLFGGLFLYLVFGRPKVEVSHEGDLTIVNPVTVWNVPAGAVGTLSKGFFHSAIITRSGRKIRLWGLEESLLGTVVGRSSLREFVSDGLRPSSHPAEDATVKWRVLDGYIACLAILHLLYLIAAMTA